ncbi:hypothetical protein GYMLUDRAFT_74019 [Collybiopsis luxurians FD-317 M1]|uniref:Steroid 5-alpha reductase C-terminal domain-containing protein n=1 Tax=Collybiopsis luxurians FD-317 M1 TaxID=944289 RepID=A0A0D0BX26_9AGAR|nr:hypothetical protein GYMLUDRAFT_74019 [Collybiopsis luxurians FD-317 M1]
MSNSKPEGKAVVFERGSYRSTPISRGLFILLRALDLPIQYAILSSRALGTPLIHALGGVPIPPTGRPVYVLGTSLGLSPQRTILLGWHYWVSTITREPISPAGAGLAGALNTFYNGANTLLFINTATSVLSYASVAFNETRLPIQTLVGIGLYIFGMGFEWISEMQRLRFKKDVRDRGRPYTKGLFRFARHVNYGGYVLWRAGFATAAAGWLWGTIVSGYLNFDFSRRAIPELDEYCGKRYGEEWFHYRKSVPYKLFPFIF